MKVKVSPTFEPIENGITSIRLNDYEDFEYVIGHQLLDHPYLIYRGQRDVKWPLRSSLDRIFQTTKSKSPTSEEALDHLEKFRYSTRGRLTDGWVPNDENSWWSLGQHFGLATPLLDWSESPYVAAYFAFFEQAEKMPTKFPDRVIYALDPNDLNKINAVLEPDQRVELVMPLLDQNPRLVNQRGLFTKLPLGQDLEDWVRTHFKGVSDGATLIKIIVPEMEDHRDKFIRILNRKNINPLTLFPDLTGASLHTNNRLSIHNY